MHFGFGFGIITTFGFGRNFGSKLNRKPKFISTRNHCFKGKIFKKMKKKKKFIKHFLNVIGLDYNFISLNSLPLSCEKQ
jgi:hypothetical protein